MLSIPSGISPGTHCALQSVLTAQCPGAAVLHADVGVLPGVSQCAGVHQVPVEGDVQELCAAKLQDLGNCMQSFFFGFKKFHNGSNVFLMCIYI